MSEAIAFDTHQFVKHLTANGFTEQQAEALADEQVNLLNSNLATKADIEALRLSTEAKIEAIKADLLKWIFGLVLSLGGLMVGLFALAIKMLGAN